MSRSLARRTGIVALLAAVAAVAPAQAQAQVPVNTSPPVITGEAVSGGLLTCSPGTWTGEPSEYAYEWRDNGVVNQFTENMSTVSKDGAAHEYTCTVRALGLGGYSEPATSAPVRVAALPDGEPKVQMTPASKVVRKGKKAYFKIKLLCPADVRGSCFSHIQFKFKPADKFVFGFLNIDLAPGKETVGLLPINPAVASGLKEAKRMKGFLVAAAESESGKKATVKKRVTLRG